MGNEQGARAYAPTRQQPWVSIPSPTSWREPTANDGAGSQTLENGTRAISRLGVVVSSFGNPYGDLAAGN